MWVMGPSYKRQPSNLKQYYSPNSRRMWEEDETKEEEETRIEKDTMSNIIFFSLLIYVNLKLSTFIWYNGPYYKTLDIL